MYAIVEIAGKHYKAEKNGELTVDLLHLDAGKKVTFDKVLVLRDDKKITVGKPYVKGVSVEAKIVEPIVKGEKITVFKYKSKVSYRVKNGHRQKYTTIKVTGIKTAETKATKPAPKAEEAPAE